MNKRVCLAALFVIINFFIFAFLSVNGPSLFGYYQSPEKAVRSDDIDAFYGESIGMIENGDAFLYAIKIKDGIRLYDFKLKGKTAVRRYAVNGFQQEEINYYNVPEDLPPFEKWYEFSPTAFNRNNERKTHFCIVKKSSDVNLENYSFQEFKHNNKSYYFVYFVEI